jgi:hypothetical protein
MSKWDFKFLMLHMGIDFAFLLLIIAGVIN